MADLGLDFKAPKENKRMENNRRSFLKWKNILFSGSDGIEFVPKNRKDYEKYLIDKRNYYELRIEKRDATLHKKN